MPSLEAILEMSRGGCKDMGSPLEKQTPVKGMNFDEGRTEVSAI
jgi:hypothetical protein